jgi:outer membrane receptor protein involved in Fe transport
MKTTAWLLLFVLGYSVAFSQPKATEEIVFSVIILNERSEPVNGAVVELWKENKLLKTMMGDAKGTADFTKMAEGNYNLIISYTGYKSYTVAYHFPSAENKLTVKLTIAEATLQEVSVTSRKPLIQQKQGKTIVNVDASVTNTGSTILEVLERSPGVTVDRNGGIALQGRAGVLVLIDDKPTYLSGTELNNLLASMNSSQVQHIELMTNPPAKYDASGNAGIINIVTKKNKQKGFNGSFTTSYGQGVYPKNNESLVLNFRSGKFNTFLNYNLNLAKYLTDLYALRKYYDKNENIVATLDQPAYFKGKMMNNTFKTGVDYYLSTKTTIGVAVGGAFTKRKGDNNSNAIWLNAGGGVDSTIHTVNTSDNHFTNWLANANVRHTISASQDISADIDWLHYSINNNQFFTNQLLAAGGYTESSRGNISTSITIVSGKIDHTLKLKKDATLQSGWKTVSTNTDNITSFQNYNGSQWVEDYGKSNHFIYKEVINALYSSYETKWRRFGLQAGVRYENTNYKANQLGNAMQKDSSFSRNYGGFFPSGYLSYEVDSSNRFTFAIGRRIDRPAFQVLNPFYSVINKYTYSTGNPYMLPQYSWNISLTHQYKSLLSTTVSYSIIKNYFSQLFLTDSVNGVLLYTQGNVGQTTNMGLSTTLTVSPFKWWSLTAQTNYNYKELKGINGNNYTTYINQLNLNINNQLTIAKIYTVEVSGFYTSKARNDIQELLYPTGQFSMGVSMPVLKKQGTLKLSARDIFYTNAMEGLTQFPNATEYFILRRDSRVLTLAFTYRFGKTYKTTKRSAGSANDEMQRVGNG